MAFFGGDSGHSRIDDFADVPVNAPSFDSPHGRRLIMPEQAAPQIKFGWAHQRSDVGWAAHYIEIPIVLVVVVVSLIAGFKCRKKNWVLPLATIVAAGVIIVQARGYWVELERISLYDTISLCNKEATILGGLDSGIFVRNGLGASCHEAIPEFERRLNRVFGMGWMLYSIMPFFFALIASAIWRRRRQPEASRLAERDSPFD